MRHATWGASRARPNNSRFPNESFDVVISNGVIDLIPDKDAVFAELFPEQPLIIDGGGEIVEISSLVIGGVFLDPGIEFKDFFRRTLEPHVNGIAVTVVAVIADGENGGEHDADFVGVSEFGHGSEIVFDLHDSHGASVAREVVRAGEDDDDSGLQRDDVRAEADEHLWRGLATDTAIDVRLALNPVVLVGNEDTLLARRK